MRYAPRRHRVTGQTVAPADLERLQDAVGAQFDSLHALQPVDQPPARPETPGQLGDVALAADGSYLYVCVAAGLWRRVALSSW